MAHLIECATFVEFAYIEAADLGGSPVPLLAAFLLHGYAEGIANLDPCAGRAGSIGTVNPLGNDALSTELACIGEHSRPIFGDVLVQQDAGFEIAQQRSLAIKERARPPRLSMLRPRRYRTPPKAAEATNGPTTENLL